MDADFSERPEAPPPEKPPAPSEVAPVHPIDELMWIPDSPAKRLAGSFELISA